jgi:hypothetical protein
MAFAVEYFHERVLAEIESWPVDVVADYARLVELVAGPALAARSTASCWARQRR